MRAGLLDKIELLKGRYPEKLRKRLIPIIYVCLPMPELVEEAAKRKVWVLKATQDFCKPEKAILNYSWVSSFKSLL
jgi:hypothetical protein